jgi:hypothetical protein
MFSKRLSGAALGAAVAIGLGLWVLPARAAYVLTLTQEGPNVVGTGSGTIDLTDLSFFENETDVPGSITPSMPEIATGPSPSSISIYGDATAPPNFGSGGLVETTIGSGDLVGTDEFEIAVPEGYVSGDKLSSSSTWDGETFKSLGVTPGVYKWTWGSGADADSFTLDAVVPEPSTWVMMLAGFAGLGLAGWTKGRAVKSAA